MDTNTETLDLGSYLKRLRDQDAKIKFAKDCGTTLGYLNLVACGARKAGGPLCLVLHEKSGYRIGLHLLRPDMYPDESFTLDPLKKAS